ncbi:MAG: glycosyltransferase family 2 protein [Flavobacteriales bacterium]
MKLTVIIVNYNVQYFLEQCLLSVEKAIQGMQTEVFVVDNNSVDGSAEMVKQKFPWVHLIANHDNPGFSKANNQAMRIAQGQYVLLLNPDTVVQEDTLHKVVGFMDEHDNAGGLGVKMVDGNGKFLPESKRGLPTPETAFYKIFGINAIFSRSKKFNRYYLGHLSNDEVHEIEILSGAFMLMRKHTLDSVGLLDEAFFMYGEDIDLSWRIIQGGWKNYYYPHSRIIHYKGESTKKGSLNYVFVFYKAMIIFAQKHFSEKNARWFSFIINVAIWLRAAVAVMLRFIKRALLPVCDAAFTLTGWWFAKNLYATVQEKIYEPTMLYVGFGVSIALWMVSAWLGGGYDKPLKPQRVFKPLFIGTAVILIAYALLPESLRFSRALLLIGALTATLVFVVNRVILSLWKHGNTGFAPPYNRRVAMIGQQDEVSRVKHILQQTQPLLSDVLTLSPSQFENDHKRTQLSEIVRVNKIDQVIFCARDISSTDIISLMSGLEDRHVEFKIAPPESLYIIGSGSIEKSGDAFMLDVNSVNKQSNQRIKRIVDLALCLIVLILLPLLLFYTERTSGLLRNLADVAIGRKTWVGLKHAGDSSRDRLSKHGILNPTDLHAEYTLTTDHAEKLNILYARDYRVMNDLSIFFRNLKHLGRQ